MSKSKGNEIVVSEILKRHEPETLRFFLLATHYRRPIDYSEERLEEIRRGLDNFYRFFERFERITGKNFYKLEPPTVRRPFEGGQPSSEFLVEVVRRWEQFLEHMDDDFNTGGAIGVLYDLLTALNRFVDQRQLEGGKGTAADMQAFERGVLAVKELGKILGIFLEAGGARKPKASASGQDQQLVSGLMQPADRSAGRRPQDQELLRPGRPDPRATDQAGRHHRGSGRRHGVADGVIAACGLASEGCSQEGLRTLNELIWEFNCLLDVGDQWQMRDNSWRTSQVWEATFPLT